MKMLFKFIHLFLFLSTIPCQGKAQDNTRFEELSIGTEKFFVPIIDGSTFREQTIGSSLDFRTKRQDKTGRPAQHTICLNMIVKDESQVIRRCLESAKPLIDYWVIVDTGSKDGTQDIIKEFMKDIPGELYERPWVNFEHNRNEALQLAKNTADYLLFIDADDEFMIDPNFIMPDLDKDSYLIDIYYGGLCYPRPQLVRANVNWRWGGAVHEALDSPEPVLRGHLDGVKMIIRGGGARSSDPKKFEKDAEVLEKALKRDPWNARNIFYLAQSYRDAGKLDLALINYERRVALGGWEEEVFWSMCQIAKLYEQLEYDENVISQGYSRAHQYRPSRAEPLYHLANYYRRKGNYLMGYIVSELGCQIPYPQDALFWEKYCYDYGILLEYSICAYWLGRYQEAYDASQKILSLKDLPLHIQECVLRNLTFIEPRLVK